MNASYEMTKLPSDNLEPLSEPLSWDELSKIVSDRGYQPVDPANGPTNS